MYTAGLITMCRPYGYILYHVLHDDSNFDIIDFVFMLYCYYDVILRLIFSRSSTEYILQYKFYSLVYNTLF